MAQLPSAFNQAEHEEMKDFSALPEGDYVAQITKSEMKKTKNHAKDGGQYLQLEFDVLQGDKKGAKFWTRLNLINKSAQAVSIANSELTSITRACGITQVISETTPLHGKPLMVHLKFVPATAQNKAQNEIGSYKPLSGGASQGGASQASTDEPAQDLQQPDWMDQ
jgi:hypothetical protein